MIAKKPLLLSQNRNTPLRMLSKTKNFISWRKRKNVRRTEKAHSTATPIGASADAKPIQGAESKNAEAHSRGRDP